MPNFLGIEIGGTKLQLGIGPGDGAFTRFWRGTVDRERGATGIREQIAAVTGELLAGLPLDGVGIGFGGPVDDATRQVITSHQIDGWDNFPLAEWVEQRLGAPTFLGNDADCAALAEATLGAGRGYDPVFYVTIGSGIGGGLVQSGRVARGTGRGAAEIGHLRIDGRHTLEDLCSGWALERRIGRPLREFVAAGSSDALLESWGHLADALCHVIALVCPARIVIGGGLSLIGDPLFVPLRRLVAERVFKPFAGLSEIVPAALGEEVVVHGAIAATRSHREPGPLSPR